VLSIGQANGMAAWGVWEPSNGGQAFENGT
jgi:hypothetical protein